MLALLTAAALLAALCATAVARPAGSGLASPLVTKPTITKQPSSVTVPAGAPASFTSEASNANSVQWERSVDHGTSFQTIAGANGNTYTIAATSTSENGYEFRAVFKNAEGGITTSSAATLTVTEKPAVTKQPADATVQVGHEAVFESAASGSPAPSAQWQKSIDGGVNWKGITGAKTNVLKLTNVQKIDDGSEYRAVFSNVAGEATSAAATLHVVEPPQVTTQPTNQTVIEGETARFNSAASGLPAPSEQWERSTNGGASWEAVEGANFHELTVPSTTTAENGYEYRAVFTNSSGTVTSSTATLTVQGRPVITLQPEDATVSPGGEATFQAAATGIPAPTVDWQVSLDGGASWSAVTGATTDTLTVANAQLSESGREYRAVFENSIGSATSRGATLTVSPTNYRAYGWGRNDRGQAGVGSSVQAITAPLAIPRLHYVTAVAAGPRHGLALLAGGTMESWGFNGHGQLGDENEVSSKSPIPVENLTGVTAIAAGGNHSVALLKNGTVDDWGDDESGQLGNGGNTDSEVPVQVKGLSGVTAVAAGEEHTLALLSNGTVMSWGNNEHGQLGNGNANSSSTPVAVKGLSGVTAISAKGNFSLALLSDGTVMAWGADDNGQLGNAEVLNSETEQTEGVGRYSPSPVPVEGLSGVTAIAAGKNHALALLEDGTVVAWGDDSEGELGNGEVTTAMVVHPVPLSGLTGVSSIAAGENDSAAVLASGRLMTWGSNSFGNLGIGTQGEPVDTPTLVSTLGQVAGVTVGGAEMIAFGEELPAVTGVSPSVGPLSGGTPVTITGTNLAGTSAVRFGANAAESFEVVSAGEIKAVAPAGTGVVDVTVVTPAGTSTAKAADRFTYLAKPVISKLSVKGGPAGGGTVLTITGSGFVAPAQVHFGEAAASNVTVTSTVSMTVTTPEMAAGKLSVTVTTPGGTSAPGGKARFKSAPVVSSVSPSSGPLAGGNTVTISGYGFAPGANITKFKFGSSKAGSVQCESFTTCTVVVPAGRAAGTVDVLVQASGGKSTASEGDRYTFE